MNDEVELLFENGIGYLESLVKCRPILKDTPMLKQLDEVITLELELALMGAEKARSELLKASKNNIKPIK